MKSHIALFFLLLASVVLVSAGESPLIGKLGKPVGTELTIKGTFQAGKNSWFLVTNVNEDKLTTPVLLPAQNLDPFAHIPLNTVCRFRGQEISYVVKAVIDRKTGREMQQASAGHHFEFRVKKVLAPEGVKTRDER